MRGSSAHRCISAGTSAPGASLRRMLLKLEPLRESSCKLCRSPQTSDSNELPSDSKTPTTFQMRLPTLRSAPNEQPGYRFKINLPTMTSFSPGANIRPAIMRTFSWIWALTGSTPRMGRLSKVSPAGINTCSVNSGETSGFPTPSRLTAGRNLRASNWSSVINELASESAARPIRIMLSGELLSLIAESRPPTIAIAATKTPTTMAMAPTVMELDTRRMNRLRRLYLKGMAICLIHQSEGLNDAAFRGCTRGNIRAKQTEERRHAQGLRQHKRRNMQ